MIFRTSGGIRELLAATPIFREWKRRELGSVLVETYHPEILEGNECVDFVGREVTNCSESVVDFDMVEWWQRPRPVTETYATYALRDLKLGSWKTEMYLDEGEIRYAGYVVRPDKLQQVALIGSGISAEIQSIVRSMDYDILVIDELEDTTLRMRAALASMADLYIGLAGDEASVVLTSDVPAVVLYSWMNPEFFKPFRRGASYEAVRVRESVCVDSLLCSEKRLLAELDKVYGVDCPHKVCKDAYRIDDVMDAVGRVCNV